VFTIGANLVTLNPADMVPWSDSLTTVTNLVPTKARSVSFHLDHKAYEGVGLPLRRMAARIEG
jgi:hypothetical protein